MKSFYNFVLTTLLALCITFSCLPLNSTETIYAIRLDNSENSFYENYNLLKVSENPLFKKDGSIVTVVAVALFKHINASTNHKKENGVSKWYKTETTYNGLNYTETTGADYSGYVATQEGMNADNAGAIIIKLFEGYGENSGYVDEFTSKWWQVVYRSTDTEKDVLTFYMVDGYRTSAFGGNNLLGNNTSFNSIADDNGKTESYHRVANYSQSIVRTNILKDFDEVLEKYPQTSNFIVKPNSIPGLWQSSAFQTNSDANSSFYNCFNTVGSLDLTAQDALGSSGLNPGASDHFAINNGLDGLSVGWAATDKWNVTYSNSSIVSNYEDKIWLPSSFETLYMGAENDVADSISQTNRTGLWQLNNIDRSTKNSKLYNWLRSGDSYYANWAMQISHSGALSASEVQRAETVRPALHIDLSAFNLPITKDEKTPPTSPPTNNGDTEDPDFPLIQTLIIAGSVAVGSFASIILYVCIKRRKKKPVKKLSKRKKKI